MPHLNPILEFALAGEMITDEEAAACRKGNMSISRSKKALTINGSETEEFVLMNLNVDIPGFPTGTKVALFYMRGHYVKINRLMGLMDNGEQFPTNKG